MGNYVIGAKAYKRQYYLKHKRKLLKQQKIKYKQNKSHILKRNCVYTKLLRKRKPWLVSLNKSRARCNNPKQHGFENYGGKGIKCLLSKEEVQKLWFRDKAWLLKKPSIDRKNSSRNYIFDNCRFIELSINSALTSRTKPETRKKYE